MKWIFAGGAVLFAGVVGITIFYWLRPLILIADLEDRGALVILDDGKVTAIGYDETVDELLELAQLELFKELEVLEIAGDPVRCDFSPLRNLLNLQGLTLRSNSFSDKDTQYLLGLKSLEYLSLRGTNISARSLNGICGIRLKVLQLGYTNLDETALVMIAECNSLQSLELPASAITPGSISELGRLSNLRRLVVTDAMKTGHVPTEIVEFSQSHPNISIDVW
ncbi:leucine-rich repeat domain-containing protein [Lignipirellula cremea]|uniref:Leucine Rich repeats (2 copies) n=1 Tax=Lignipirellula cremea TaxID=2528010 RepID=A0A518DZ34_9BACT|nr:hypothetical protein [Lignipirellula cremea]QDU97107.1 Leucine Rich repeats (2 copies) [Lignipirellula cremea]